MWEDSFFNHRRVREDRLRPFGFVEAEAGHVWSADLLDGEFTLEVLISPGGKVTSRVIETAFGEEYVAFRVSGAAGAFVGRVRQACEEKFAEIAARCFEPDVFQSDDAKRVVRYIADRYGDEPEFLWERFPGNAIFRRKDNAKWYAALLILPKHKIGLSGDGTIEILDLRVSPGEVDALVDGVKYLPGYHMNKRTWFTVRLDGTLAPDELASLIDTSYRLALKK